MTIYLIFLINLYTTSAMINSSNNDEECQPFNKEKTEI